MSDALKPFKANANVWVGPDYHSAGETFDANPKSDEVNRLLDDGQIESVGTASAGKVDNTKAARKARSSDD